MTFLESVVFSLLFPAGVLSGYMQRRRWEQSRPDPSPATHVPIACPICHDRIMVPISSVASAGFVIRRDDLDIQAHMLTHPETR